jgi:hypothetical protein
MLLVIFDYNQNEVTTQNLEAYNAILSYHSMVPLVDTVGISLRKDQSLKQWAQLYMLELGITAAEEVIRGEEKGGLTRKEDKKIVTDMRESAKLRRDAKVAKKECDDASGMKAENDEKAPVEMEMTVPEAKKGTILVEEAKDVSGVKRRDDSDGTEDGIHP